MLKLAGDLSGDVKNTEVDRRAGFVDSLLNDASDAVVSVDLSDTSVQSDSHISHAQEDKSSRDVGIDMNAESTFLVSSDSVVGFSIFLLTKALTVLVIKWRFSGIYISCRLDLGT